MGHGQDNLMIEYLLCLIAALLFLDHCGPLATWIKDTESNIRRAEAFFMLVYSFLLSVLLYGILLRLSWPE